MKRRCGRRRYYSVLLAPQRPKRVLWREGQLPLVAPEFNNIEKSDVGVVGCGYVYFEAPSCLSKGEVFEPTQSGRTIYRKITLRGTTLANPLLESRSDDKRCRGGEGDIPKLLRGRRHKGNGK